MEHNNKLKKAKIALLAMQRYSWEQGVTTHAFIDAGDEDVVIALARESVHRQVKDGRAAIVGNNVAITDPCSVGEAINYAWKKTGDEYFKAGLDNLLKWTMETAKRNEEGILYHWEKKPQMWSDSTYMLPPFLAAVGLCEEAYKQMNGLWDLLYCKEKKLLHHMWNDETKEYDRAAFWGGGNGWALAAIARMLPFFPEEMQAEKNDLIHKAKELLDSALRYITEDGLSYDILDDDTSFVEVNFPQMCAYTIYKGVADGWLEECYLEKADLMREAANNKMDAYGLIQDVCGAPAFDSPGTAPEAQAFYILMEVAAENTLSRK